MANITIIIPVYNLHDYIEDCISSIYNQDFDDYTVVISDDGSVDLSSEQIEEIAICDEKIAHISKKNGGVSSARNVALDIASGEYVWFIDGDDYIHPNSLRLIAEFLSHEKSLDYISFKMEGTEQRYPQYSFRTTLVNSPYVMETNTYQGMLEQFVKLPYSVCMMCMRKKSVEGMRFFPICTSEDALFAMQLTLKSKATAYWEAYPYFYYKRPGSFTNSCYNYRKYEDYISFIEQVMSLDTHQGKYDGLVSFMLYRSILPSLFKQSLLLANRQERKLAFLQFLVVLDGYEQKFFGRTKWYVSICSHIHSYLLCYLFFYLRYYARDVVLNNKLLFSLYKFIR